jgi:hypothetical protein
MLNNAKVNQPNVASHDQYHHDALIMADSQTGQGEQTNWWIKKLQKTYLLVSNDINSWGGS